MTYKEYIIQIETNGSLLEDSDIFDLLIAIMGDLDFESFSVENGSISGYIQKDKADDNKLKEVFLSFPVENVTFRYTVKDLDDINWNEEWEKNYFAPQVFSCGRCVIRAPFHRPFPDAEIELLISPKMAFGTGNHQTTSLMIDYIMSVDMKGKSVLDMGCGTGILGLLAMKMGAESLVAVDIDKWAYENVKEHAEINGVNVKEVILGDASSIKGKGMFDLVFANITRNILIEDMDKYVSEMNENSTLVLSGFYENDIPLLVSKAESIGLAHVNTSIKDNWALLELRKIK